MQKSKRQVQKERTRGKILQAAFKVYSESGFTAATSTIAKEAGIAHGSIFLHFPTTDDLLSCLMNEFKDSMEKRFQNLSDSSGSIEELLSAHIDILTEYEEFYTRFISGIVLLPDGAATILASIQSGFASYFNIVLEREIENGVLRKLPAQLLQNTWIGLIHYYLQNKELFSPESSVLKRYKKQLIFTYCELIRRW